MDRESEGFFEKVFEGGRCEVDALESDFKAFEDAFDLGELEPIDGAFPKVEPDSDAVNHGLILGEQSLEIAQQRSEGCFFVEKDLESARASFDVDGMLFVARSAAKGRFGGFAFKQHQ